VTRQVKTLYYPITGPTGGVYPRPEIHELEEAGGELWNLFLLASTDFQGMDQSIIDLYYQIAGASSLGSFALTLTDYS
jgi:tyrosinase